MTRTELAAPPHPLSPEGGARGTAEAALAAYGFAGAALTPLSEGVHATFRVEPRAGERYALRVYGAGTHGPAAIHSELVWLSSLRAAGLLVPEPVAALDGAWAGGGVALTRWLEGETPRGALDAPTCRRLGELMARLHRHAERFAPPAGFARPRYDLDRLLGTGEAIPPGSGGELLAAQDREILDRAAAAVRRDLSPLGEGRDAFGLVHGDLQVTNYVFHQGQVGAIDFADFGWGYYLYDAATLLLPLWERRDFAELADAFLRGYRQVRPLAEGQWALLEPFLAARALYLLRWTAESWDRPAVRAGGEVIVPHVKEQIARFLARREPTAVTGTGTGEWARASVVHLLARFQERGIRLWEENASSRSRLPRGR
jgi:Ser/Thr protein kinase RdoA (MazF antagonist)